jgi:hypothetical protein
VLFAVHVSAAAPSRPTARQLFQDLKGDVEVVVTADGPKRRVGRPRLRRRDPLFIAAMSRGLPRSWEHAHARGRIRLGHVMLLTGLAIVVRPSPVDGRESSRGSSSDSSELRGSISARMRRWTSWAASPSGSRSVA